MNRMIILSLFLLLSNCKTNQLNNTDNMVLIPGGSFYMGTDTSEALELAKNYPTLCDFTWFEDQFPKHKVTLDTFYIDKYEVTFSEYKVFVTSTHYVSKGNWQKYFIFLKDSMKLENNVKYYPVIGVSWEDANAYCNWKGKRLPTEAEWEYVAKGITKNSEYPWGSEYDPSKANVQNNNGPLPVGTYSPNSYGIFDLGGNAQEWCYDYYDKKYYTFSDSSNPNGPKEGNSRVVRGGSWYLSGRFYSRSASRSTITNKDNHFNFIGFRCAKDYNK